MDGLARRAAGELTRERRIADGRLLERRRSRSRAGRCFELLRDADQLTRARALNPFDYHHPRNQGSLERIWATSGDLKKTPARIIRGFRGNITWVIDRAAGGMG